MIPTLAITVSIENAATKAVEYKTLNINLIY